MVDDTRTLTTPDGDMGVVIRRPDGDGPFPVIVLFHHGPGLDAGSIEAMEKIAGEGFYVISHDRYHREGAFVTFDRAKMAEEGEEAFKRFFAVLAGTTDDMVATDVAAVLEEVASDPAARQAPMGCIGYCIGARSVLRTMQAHPDVFAAGVALHPSYCATDEPDSPHRKVPQMRGSLYAGIAGDDQMISEEERKTLAGAVAELGERGSVDWLEGADHGFAVPGPRYEAAAAEQAYERAFALFKNAL